MTWSLLRKTITVHPLGGVRPGSDVSSSVVDETGEVHGYPGLFVMDGSTLPAATGVNPSATILAATERAIESVIRAAGRPGWRAPEWEDVSPAPVPEDSAFVVTASVREATKGDGIRFAERMATPGRRRPRLDMRLSAEVRSIDHFLSDPAHSVSIQGVIDVEGLASNAGIAGTLSLFPRDVDEAMRYSLRFDDDSGRPWQLTGVKTTRTRRPMALLSGLTTLSTEISPVGGTDTETIRSLLTIDVPGLAQLGSSLRGQGFTRARRLRAAARFLAFFTRSALSGPRVGRSGSRSARP